MTNKKLFLGSYCDWLKCHPVLLKSVIPVLLDSISDITLTSAATQALRDICQECSHDLDRESLIAILNKCQVWFIDLFSIASFIHHTVGNVYDMSCVL